MRKTEGKQYDPEQSQATSIQNPFTKDYWTSQRWLIRQILKTIYFIFKPELKIRPFKKPLLLLIRNTREVQFYENATEGKFRFVHTNGDIVERQLLTQKLLRFTYRKEGKEKDIGKYSFNGYILNEDAMFPEPQEIEIDAERVKFIFDKSLTDTKVFEARLKRIEMEGWQGLLLVIAVGIAIIVGINWMTKGGVVQIINTILGRDTGTTTETAKQVIENITKLPLIIPAYIGNLKKKHRLKK